MKIKFLLAKLNNFFKNSKNDLKQSTLYNTSVPENFKFDKQLNGKKLYEHYPYDFKNYFRNPRIPDLPPIHSFERYKLIIQN